MQGGDERAWRRFVHRCSLLARCGWKGVACMIALVHADVEDDGQWVTYLEHAAQVWQERSTALASFQHYCSSTELAANAACRS